MIPLSVAEIAVITGAARVKPAARSAGRDRPRRPGRGTS